MTPCSEPFSDNLAKVSIHGKSKNIHIYGGNYFAGVDLEGKKAGAIPGRSSELANLPNGHRLLSEKPRPAIEAQARPVSTVRKQVARLGTGSLHPRQEVFTNPAGPGAWSGISRTSQQHFQRAAE